MNDFTKEELLIILLDIEVQNNNPGAKVQVIVNKLKSMIDNYCEHKWHTNPYDYILYCQKCGINIINDSQEKIINA